MKAKIVIIMTCYALSLPLSTDLTAGDEKDAYVLEDITVAGELTRPYQASGRFSLHRNLGNQKRD